MRWCFSELFEAEKKNKLTEKFVVNQFYYNVLSDYFSPLLNDSLRYSIEQNVIKEIPTELIE